MSTVTALSNEKNADGRNAGWMIKKHGAIREELVITGMSTVMSSGQNRQIEGSRRDDDKR
jgi:hypothetical protein